MNLKIFQRSRLPDRDGKKKKSNGPVSNSWSSGHFSLQKKELLARLDGTESTHHCSLPSIRTVEDDLLNDYDYSPELQDKFKGIRAKDFARLDAQQCRYFDYTGGMVAPESLLRAHHLDLMSCVLGNPHSEHKPSKDATMIELEARNKVLSFCDASPDEYVVIWTPNASGALKVVGECYPFNKNGAYLYAPDCHNSLLGISRFAEHKKATAKGFDFVSDTWCYDFDHFRSQVQRLGKATTKAPKLLGICGESNVSGLVHNVKKYTDFAHSQGWDVCLDAAALAPTKKISMARLGKPEFLCMSFYKIFGYPTGVGCLVAKKSALMKFEKPWFAGGTVRVVGVSSNAIADFQVSGDKSAKYEDGTINYTSFQAVINGLNYMETVGLEDLSKHVQYFSALLEQRLRSLTWPNGNPLVYIPPVVGEDEGRGNVICAKFLNPDGSLLPHKVVEKVFCEKGIAARTGCFCNPGSALQILGPYLKRGSLSPKAYIEKYMVHFSKNDDADRVITGNHWLGFVRMSVGLPTTMADMDGLLDCIQEDIISKPEEIQRASLKHIKSAPIPYGIC